MTKLIQYRGAVYRLVASALPEPTPEMVEHFTTRTQEHIDRVKKFLLLLDGTGDFTPEEITQRGEAHDADKFTDEKFIPYVWVDEYYRIKNSGEEVPADVKAAYDATREASGDHVTINRHHPESHEDLNDMTDLDVAEMVSDWSAMAEELGAGSARGWADKNVGTKWKLDEEHVELIYSMIEQLEAASEKQDKPRTAAGSRILYHVGKRPPKPYPLDKYQDLEADFLSKRQHYPESGVFLTSDPIKVQALDGVVGNVYALSVPEWVIAEAGGMHRIAAIDEIVIPDYLWRHVKFIGRSPKFELPTTTMFEDELEASQDKITAPTNTRGREFDKGKPVT